MRLPYLAAFAVAALMPWSSAHAVQNKAPAPAVTVKIKTATIATGINSGWGMEFLPDGRILVSEKPGTMRIVSRDGGWTRVAGVPRVANRGQGGLLDIELAPDFATSGMLYFSYAEDRGGGCSGTTLAAGRLVDDPTSPRLDNVRVLFRQQPDYDSTNHFGSRIAFAPDGTLFLTVGDRFSARDQAQNPANNLGKIIRLDRDGAPARDNPRKEGWAAENFSIGHRNVQAAAINPATGRLWTAEHGARGGDEVNHPEAGKNYGWPVITYGRDYSGAKIGIGTAKEGLEQPVYYWDPSIAPSGMAFYTADLVPEWKGSVFVGALAGSHIARLVLDGDQVVAEERLLTGLGERFRDVKQGPDGSMYALTDGSGGRIIRITPDR